MVRTGIPRDRLLLALLVAGVWLPARNACFFWDDQSLVVDNATLADGDVLGILSGGLFTPHAAAAVTYHRPLTLLSLLLDRTLFGLDPTGYHLHNVLLHVAVVVSVHTLAARRASRGVAAAVAVIAGLHPALSEAVLWTPARGDLLATVLILGGLLVLDSPSRRAPVVLFLLAWLAPLAKETGYLLPLVAFGWRAAAGARLRRTEGMALALGAGLALGMRTFAQLGVIAPAEASGFGVAEVMGRATVFAAAWTTLPWPLTSSTSVHVPFTAGVIGGALATLCLTSAVAVRGGRPARVLLVAAALTWVPSLFAIVRTGLFGERYLYLPMMLGLLAGTYAARDGRRLLVIVGSLAVPALVVLGVRMSDWTSPEALVEAAAARQPYGVALLHLAQVREAEGDPEAAVALYDQALAEARPVLAACAPAVRLRRTSGDLAGAITTAQRLDATGCAGRAAYVAERAAIGDAVRAATRP